MTTGRVGDRRSGPVLLVALAWAVAVAVAGALAVVALRSAGAAPDATVVSAAEAAELASSAPAASSPAAVSPSATPSSAPPTSPAPAPTVPGATPTPTDGDEALGLGVGTLGARCDGGVPRYLWFVPAAGWVEHDREEDDGRLELEVRSEQEQRTFTIGCDSDGRPVLVATE